MASAAPTNLSLFPPLRLSVCSRSPVLCSVFPVTTNSVTHLAETVFFLPLYHQANNGSLDTYLVSAMMRLMNWSGKTSDFSASAPINNRLNMVVWSPAPFGLGRNGCWPSRGPQLPWALSFIFSLCCRLNDCRRAAHSIYKIGPLFSLFLFSCPSLALLRLLILLMSANVHPNPGPILPCSVCAGNVTWQGKSVQCCTCSNRIHLRCSQLSLSKFRALGNSHSWSFPPPAITL